MAEEPLSGNAQSHHKRAEILSDLGRSERALDEAFAAIRADPEDCDGYYSAARALLAVDKDEEALEYANKGLAKRTTSWGLRLRSVALSALGRHVEALEAAEEAVAVSPMEWRCRTRLARCLTSVYRGEDADRTLAKAAELYPDGARIFAQWARVALALEDPERAEELARKAVALDPLEIAALSALGHVLQHKKPSDDLGAFAAYVQAFRQDPTRADLRARVVETGRSGAMASVDMGTGAVVILLGISACVACNWPPAWCLVITLGIFGISFVRHGHRRARVKLDEAVEGGADLFFRLWKEN